MVGRFVVALLLVALATSARADQVVLANGSVLEGTIVPGSDGTTITLRFPGGGALADILLGVMILWRPSARMAAIGMIGLSVVYLVGSLMVAPDLWLDPLGPMVKVIPSVVLAAMVALTLEER